MFMTCTLKTPKYCKINLCKVYKRASQVALVVKNPPASVGDLGDPGSISDSGRSPGGGHGNTLQYGESHGQRSLVGYSPWGRKESDTTKATQHVHIVFIDWKYQYG